VLGEIYAQKLSKKLNLKFDFLFGRLKIMQILQFGISKIFHTLNFYLFGNNFHCMRVLYNINQINKLKERWKWLR
jgi:hypothetical protein